MHYVLQIIDGAAPTALVEEHCSRNKTERRRATKHMVLGKHKESSSPATFFFSSYVSLPVAQCHGLYTKTERAQVLHLSTALIVGMEGTFFPIVS